MDLEAEKLNRILSWLNGKKSNPFKMVLIPTNRCNLKCIFCPNSLPRTLGKFRKKDELKDGEWLRVVEEGLKLGVREWSIIGGGEPLLRYKTVISLIELIKTQDFVTDCELITNGTLFKRADIKRLVEVGVDRILFSIDSPFKKTYEELRGVKKAFEKSIKNLKLFTRFKKKLKKEKPYLKVNMVLTSKNFKEISEMVRFVKKLGAQELALHPMRIYWEFVEEMKHLKINRAQQKEMMEEIEKASKLAKRLGLFLNRDMVELEILKDGGIEKCFCFEPLYSMLIDPEGYVNACTPAGSGLKSLNVRKYSLKKIWFSKELMRIRKKVMGGKGFEYCEKCGLLDMKVRIRNKLLEIQGK